MTPYRRSTLLALLTFALGAIAALFIGSAAIVLGAHQPRVGPGYSANALATPAPTCGPESNYTVTQASFGRIGLNADQVPGSACDECVLSVNMPITFTMYGQSFTNVVLGDNGTLSFVANPNPPGTTCLPAPGFTYAILPYWDNLTMNFSGGGIYTTYDANLNSFAIEWRARKGSDPVNFEVTLYETTGRIEVIFGSVSNSGDSATVGVQRDATLVTEFSCDAPSLFPGLLLTFTQPPCPTGTPTPAGSRTSTRTSTVTATHSPTRTTTATVTPTSIAANVLVGHVTWQGRPAQPHPLQQLPISLTLKSATIEQNYPAQTTDASGFFTVTTGNLPPGIYQYRVKGTKYLANSGTVSLQGLYSGEHEHRIVSEPQSSEPNALPSTQVEIGFMRTGDANNDNTVTVADFNILARAFGHAVGDPAYDDRADFSGDQTVNIVDFNLLKLNFGMTGAPPIRPQ